MFLLKKLIAPLFLPVPLCVELLIIGLILLWFTSKQKAGKIIVSIGVGLLVLTGYGIGSNTLLRSLEYSYPPLITVSQPANVDEQPIKWIVVLGAGGTFNPQLPSTSQLSDASLARLVEAIRLHRALPNSKLILSEGPIFSTTAGAEVMSKAALELGVNEQDIVLEANSRDTEEEAQFIKPVIGEERFILVTSASHMPRSVALFNKLGMKPIPAPTDYLAKDSYGITPNSLFPNAWRIRGAELATYEYLGLAWAKIRGKI